MNRLLFALLIAVSGAGIIWGLMIVGGPEQARKEKRDTTRFSDLHRVAQHYRCQQYTETRGNQSSSPSYCRNEGETPPDLKDPHTGEAYRYVLNGPNSFEVCATFEATIGVSSRGGRQGYEFDGYEGCLGYVRRDAEASWRTR